MMEDDDSANMKERTCSDRMYLRVQVADCRVGDGKLLVVRVLSHYLYYFLLLKWFF